MVADDPEGDAVKPVRLQLSRAKGFSLQALSLATNGLPAVNVARPSKWGNPFRVGQQYMPAVHPHEVTAVKRGCFTEFSVGEHKGIPLIYLGGPLSIERVMSLYRAHILETAGAKAIRAELAGKNLACWCKTAPCHAEVLLEISNEKARAA